MCYNLAIRSFFGAVFTASRAASLVGAAMFTLMFAVGGIGYAMSIGQMRPGEIFGPIMVAPFIFLLTSVISAVITVPVTAIAMIVIYPLIKALGIGGQKTFGSVGFALGVLVWLFAFPGGL